MGSRIRVGVIGAGAIAQEHVSALRELGSQFVVTGIAEVDSGRREDFARDHQVKDCYSSGAELIEKGGVDVVVVATPPAFHESDVILALGAGKYVVCEKPLAHTLEAAERILAASSRQPGKLSVGHQMRFSHEHRRLRWLCESGSIGELESAVVERHGEVPALHQKSGGWWGKWEVAGGGVAITQMIHELDLLVSLFGPAVSVEAKLDTQFSSIESEDSYEALIQFRGGRTAICRGSVNSRRSGGIFRVSGSKGNARLPGIVTMASAEKEKQVVRKLNFALPETRPPSMSLLARGRRKLARKLGRQERLMTPHLGFYESLADAVRRGKEVPVPVESAMPALQLCMGIYESGLRGEEVSLPLREESRIYGGIGPADYQARKGIGVPHIASKKSDRLRVGLVGLDTSHAPTFTQMLNDPSAAGHIPGAEVVAGWPGGSDDMEISSSRVGGFTHELRAQGVRILDHPGHVAEVSDLIIITASDGRVHPELLRETIGAGKPIFVDKPFAVSSEDAKLMIGMGTESGVPVTGCSAFRYAVGLVDALHDIQESGEKITACEVDCWLPIQPTQGRYFWYGIHAAEMMEAVMGRGACSVQAEGNEESDEIEIRYADGRSGRILGSRNDSTFAVRIETDQQIRRIDLGSSISTLANQALWAFLDRFGGSKAPRLWRASPQGGIGMPRKSRLVDPEPEDIAEVIQTLDWAQQSFETGRPAGESIGSLLEKDQPAEARI